MLANLKCKQNNLITEFDIQIKMFLKMVSKTTIKLKFWSNAKYTCFGMRGCSVGMYSRGGFYFYVYGVKGIIALEIDKRWGDFNY